MSGFWLLVAFLTTLVKVCVDLVQVLLDVTWLIRIIARPVLEAVAASSLSEVALFKFKSDIALRLSRLKTCVHLTSLSRLMPVIVVMETHIYTQVLNAGNCILPCQSTL